MRSAIGLLAALCLLAVASGHVRQEMIPPNRCLPGQSCFPSRSVLAEFDATLSGRVIVPTDAAYRELVVQLNSRYTRHPYIIVLAADAMDVQKAMRFARKHQLQVTSQSDNDDPSGRANSMEGSLSINLSQMRAVSAGESTERSEFGEITAQAGANWEQVYEQARVFGRDVVAPKTDSLQLSVGSSVGDGGIGPLFKTYGLVSDNVLEAQVVLADGSLATVTENSVTVNYGDGLISKKYDWSLFAALTGGGIGPYGIVTAWTFKMVPAPASVVEARVTYRLWQAGDFVGRNVLEAVVSVLDALPDSWSGYIYLDGTPSANEVDSKGTLIVSLLYYGVYGDTPDYYFIDNLLNLDAADSLISAQIFNRTSVLAYEQAQPQTTVNYRGYLFNVLLQTDKIGSVVDASEKLTDALLFSLNNPTVESTYYCQGIILGGAGQNDPRNYSFVNPALRSSIMSLTCGLEFPDTGVDDTFYISHALDFEELFRPFMYGKYRYYAEEDVADWKKTFHGDMYGDLIDTKLKYDIDNFLWCHNCVGSDFRIDCMYNDRHKGLLLSGYVNAHRAGRVFMANHARDGRDKRIRQPYMEVMKIVK